MASPAQEPAVELGLDGLPLLPPEPRPRTRAESWAVLDQRCREKLGIDVEEFSRRYHAGEYHSMEDHLKVAHLVFALEGLENKQAARGE